MIKKVWKKAWKLIKRGVIFWLVIGVFLALIFWLLGFIDKIIDHNFVDDARLNWLIKMAIPPALVVVTGAILSMRRLKQWLTLRVQNPLVLSLTLLFFGDENEDDDFKEAIFYLEGHATIGIVTAKDDLPENLFDPASVLVKWCYVLGPPTPPFSFTAQLRLVKESDLIYTGRTALDTTLTVAALGSNLKLNPRKFKIMKQKPPPTA